MNNLEDLELLFYENDLDIDGPTDDQLYQMYGIFLDDFQRHPLIHRGREVIFNTNRSKHPLFRGKFQGFVHLITRKSFYTDRREYDRERANRFHWVKSILYNWEDPLVTYFERVNKDDQLQYFYWLQTLDFIVILRELNPQLLLVTSFCVDEYQRRQFREHRREYLENR